jgi:hypothetical protein
VTAIAQSIGAEPPTADISNHLQHAEIRKRQFLAYLRQYPLVFLKIHALSLIPFFFGDGYITSFSAVSPTLSGSDRPATDWLGSSNELVKFIRVNHGLVAGVFWFGKLIRIAVMFLVFLGVWHWWKRSPQKRIHLIFLLLVIYYFALATGVVSYSRFRLPVDPYLYFLAGLGGQYLYERAKNLKEKAALKSAR